MINPSTPVIINISPIPEPLPYQRDFINGSKILSAKMPPSKNPIGINACTRIPLIEKILPCIVIGTFSRKIAPSYAK